MATQTVPTEAHQPVEEKVDDVVVSASKENEDIPRVEESLSPGEKGAGNEQIEPPVVEVSKESISDAVKRKPEGSEEKPKIVEQLKEVEEKIEVKSEEVTENIETISTEGGKTDSVVPEEAKPEGHSEQVAEKVEILSKEVDKLDLVAPEFEAKLEGKSEEVTEKVETVSVEVAEVEAKLGQPEVTEKVETVSEEGKKPVLVVPEVEAKQEPASEVEPKVKDEETLADKVDEKISEVEETSVVVSEQVVSTNQEPEAAEKEDVVQSSLPDVTEKKEPSGVDAVVSLSKEAVVEESTQPVKEEGVKSADAQVTETASPGENTGKDKDAEVVKNGSEEMAKDEKPAIDETNKDGKTEEKLDDANKAVSKPVKEPPKTELEVKEREVPKDGDGTKTSQDLPKEAPAKPTQKQSTNLISKVKQSLLKAKKAIAGKSPTSKTKDDVKAK